MLDHPQEFTAQGGFDNTEETQTEVKGILKKLAQMQNLPFEYLKNFSKKELDMFCKRNTIIQKLNTRANQL